MARAALLGGQLALDLESLLPPVPAPAPDPHQRGWITLPYDTAALGPAGTVVPAWVCCRCHGAETGAYLLSINHGCCEVAVPSCTLLRRAAGRFAEHWTAEHPEVPNGG